MAFNGFDLSTISDAKFGSTQVQQIYYGSTLIWPTGPTPPHDYSQDYFTIVVTYSGREVNNHPYQLYWYTTDDNHALTISYSTDNGTSWSSVTASSRTMGSSAGNLIGTFNTGDKILFKANNSAYSDGTWNNYFTTDGIGSIDVCGNIMSLLYGDNFINKFILSTDYVFYYFFYSLSIDNSENLILPATTLSKHCYERMFNYWTTNTLQTTVKILPATTLTESCYQNMFSACRDIYTGPELPATTLAKKCYSGMFGSSGLSTAPELPATTLVDSCYASMYSYCSRLNYIKCLATSGINSYNSTYRFTDGVASSGTFVKASGSSWPTGVNGIPSNWTTQNV